ncbi:MAG: RNA-binding transcriptional accessory protein [Bacteroidetes bacterium]|nr:RNA-binding transcriptional accessory protein [Bacteroidota bacterium]MBS1756056.1 RNA-binding transcriptional accessory protein [Bacteroidota bacterium]
MINQLIAHKLSIRTQQVDTVLQLLAEGATIPFIARYRKDMTGALDEVQIQQVQDENKLLCEFADRKAFIEKTITDQGKMTEELQQKINEANNISQLEDIYLPYKQKRKTKAVTARENGLQALADMLLAQKNIDIEKEAATFINEKVTTAELALQGARDIIAEQVNEDIAVREKMRKLFEQQAVLKSTVIADKENDAAKYKDYFAFSEPIATIPSHRTLAVLRGFLEGYLRISIEPLEEQALELLESMYLTGMSTCSEQIRKAIKEGYRRLLQPGMETEFRTALKTAADEEAINVFAENLRQLLLSAPLGSKKILAIDPGYRTGCKVVCIDGKGELQKTDLIFVHEKNRMDEAAHKIKYLIKEFAVEAIAIGDGTAGRETEQFVKSLQPGIPVYLVNEDGASIYSASEVARQEFPDEDITIRGAVSIGRRLMDPLAELVKIDPKSIGVGQYQHDVNQPRLKERLDQTVMSCVNNVGVNVNTASKHLLSYVSGIGSSIAENIVSYRKQQGMFTSRKQLLKIPRLGGKAFEQCAGFLRIPGANNILDASAVHPESYELVEKISADLNIPIDKLIGNEEALKTISVKKYTNDTFGEHTIKDIINELKKPGLDPRSDAQLFEFAQIFSIEDVKVGMEVPGIVTNLTRFGAFIDIGVKQDGLVHVSEIAHKYIQDPSEVLKLNQQVKVKVLEVDIARKRITLSIKQTEAAPSHAHKPKAQSFSKIVKEAAPANMQDALAALKMKFGK